MWVDWSLACAHPALSVEGAVRGSLHTTAATISYCIILRYIGAQLLSFATTVDLIEPLCGVRAVARAGGAETFRMGLV